MASVNFIYCENVQLQVLPNGRQNSNIVNPLNSIKLISLPGNYTFSASCTIDDIDLNTGNVLSLDFCDPEGNVIFSTGDIPIQPALNPSKFDNINFTFELRNQIFNVEGEYYSSVKLNGEEVGNYKILIKKV